MIKKIKDKNAPKRPLTSFILFGNYLRETDTDIQKLPIKEQAIEIGKRWSSASEKDKAKYEEIASNLKKEYSVKRAEYEKSDQYKEFMARKKDMEEKDGGKKTRKRGPVKMSGYRLFVKELKPDSNDEKDPELASKNHVAKAAIKWARLSEGAKKTFNDRAAAMPVEGGSNDEN